MDGWFDRCVNVCMYVHVYVCMHVCKYLWNMFVVCICWSMGEGQ